MTIMKSERRYNVLRRVRERMRCCWEGERREGGDQVSQKRKIASDASKGEKIGSRTGGKTHIGRAKIAS